MYLKIKLKVVYKIVTYLSLFYLLSDNFIHVDIFCHIQSQLYPQLLSSPQIHLSPTSMSLLLLCHLLSSVSAACRNVETFCFYSLIYI